MNHKDINMDTEIIVNRILDDIFDIISSHIKQEIKFAESSDNKVRFSSKDLYYNSVVVLVQLNRELTTYKRLYKEIEK